MLWPDMNSQIEDAVSNCPACTEHQSSNPKEPMIAHKLPDRSWQNVATDLFELDNEQYLIVVDYYSRYFELEGMPTTASAAVINKIKSIFSRHGIPEKVVSVPTTALNFPHRSLCGSPRSRISARSQAVPPTLNWMVWLRRPFTLQNSSWRRSSWSKEIHTWVY